MIMPDDNPAEKLYSILCQLYEGELTPDEGFQQMLDILSGMNIPKMKLYQDIAPPIKGSK